MSVHPGQRNQRLFAHFFTFVLISTALWPASYPRQEQWPKYLKNQRDGVTQQVFWAVIYSVGHYHDGHFLQTCRRHSPQEEKTDASGGPWALGDDNVSISYHICHPGVEGGLCGRLGREGTPRRYRNSGFAARVGCAPKNTPKIKVYYSSDNKKYSLPRPLLCWDGTTSVAGRGGMWEALARSRVGGFIPWQVAHRSEACQRFTTSNPSSPPADTL